MSQQPGNGHWEDFSASPADLFGAIRCTSAAWMRMEIDAVSPSAPLQEAVCRMWWRQRGAVAVVEDGQLVGALAEHDLLRISWRALERKQTVVEDEGDSLVVWEQLLEDLVVRDVMTHFDELAVADAETSLHDGIERIAAASTAETPKLHVFVVDAERRLQRVVSIRDVCRYLIALYSDSPGVPFLEEIASVETLRSRVTGALDLQVESIRGHRAFGHPPVLASIEDSGADMLGKMWRGQRGYVLVTFFDGAPQGICTRRDLLCALKDPFVRLRDLRVSRLMSAQVKAASQHVTLGGVFRLMTMGGCRHMPLLAERGRVECMLSMWEGVSLLAGVDAEPPPLPPQP